MKQKIGFFILLEKPLIFCTVNFFLKTAFRSKTGDAVFFSNVPDCLRIQVMSIKTGNHTPELSKSGMNSSLADSSS